VSDAEKRLAETVALQGEGLLVKCKQLMSAGEQVRMPESVGSATTNIHSVSSSPVSSSWSVSTARDDLGYVSGLGAARTSNAASVTAKLVTKPSTSPSGLIQTSAVSSSCAAMLQPLTDVQIIEATCLIRLELHRRY